MTRDGNTIYITSEYLNNLKEIGAGTDGIVFNYDKDTLFKIYRKSLFDIKNDEKIMEAKVKIADLKNIEFKNEDKNFNYYQNDGEDVIKLRTADAISMAIRKQKNIKRTELPKGPIYIDNKFSGCILKKLNGIQIHKLTGLPTKLKHKIIKSLIIDLEELLKNNVYHTDLENSPYSIAGYIDGNGESQAIYGHSHVLVDIRNLKTNIIDLDGKTTVYLERYDEKYEQKTLQSLCTLLIEFLYKIDTDEVRETDEIYFELLKHKINEELAKKIAYKDFSSIDEVKKLLKI